MAGQRYPQKLYEAFELKIDKSSTDELFDRRRKTTYSCLLVKHIIRSHPVSVEKYHP